MNPNARALAVLVAGLAFAAVTLEIARRSPSYSLTGVSVAADFAYVRVSVARAAVEFGAGFALLLTGAVALTRGERGRIGWLLAAASVAWFLTDWGNPGAGWPVTFTAGLALSTIAAPVVAHVGLAYPSGRLAGRWDRLGVVVAYAGAVGLLGIVPALVYDPSASDCGVCPRNLLLVHASPGIYSWLGRVGIHVGLAWALALITLIALRLVRVTPALRRIVWPVALPNAAFLALVAWDYAHSLGRGSLGADSTDRRLWLGEGAALIALSLGAVWTWARTRQMRTAVARLVLDLVESPPPGGLGALLAKALGDPSLRIAYPLPDGRLVDAHGNPATLAGELTPLVRGDQQLAVLAHRPRLPVDPEIIAAAGLALENERLHADARAHLDDLRASRARIVAAGDSERRRLERNLHDGAQQGLVALTLTLRHTSSLVDAAAEPDRAARLDEAAPELGEALEDLRKLAHGIFPAVLADEGLAPALETFADETAAEVEVDIASMPQVRLDPAVETAAYFTVVETLRQTRAARLWIEATLGNGRLTLDVEADGAIDDPTVLEDRVGALDGSLTVQSEPSRVRIRAEIPCGS